MPKKSKGKKGKKKKEQGPEIRTTMGILQERQQMMCPRMGDTYTRTMKVEEILQDVSIRTLQKCAQKQQDSVNLSGMKLSLLPNFVDIDIELYNLVDINLSRNHLFSASQVFGVLSQLDKLKRLNLNENFLNGVLDEAVGEMGRLEVLHLDGNQITGFPKNTNSWVNLKVLTMSDNHIIMLPPEACEWVNLTYINMKSNRVTDLPSNTLKAWTKLERICFGLNKLRVIPEEIGFCQRLMEVDFSANMIDSVPVGLAMCNQIITLNLSQNKITEIPPDVFALLLQLKELQLYKNKLTEIPSEIGNLKALKRLSLSSNNLKGLPDEIGACGALKELYINNNAKFSLFPGSCGHLRQLQELSMRKCPALKGLPSTTMDMVALRELDVRAAKKQVCKITPEVADILKQQRCVLRGGVVKKAKGGKKK